MSEPDPECPRRLLPVPGSDAGLMTSASRCVRGGPLRSRWRSLAAARRRLPACFFGLLAPSAGEVPLDGEVVCASEVTDAIAAPQRPDGLLQDPFFSLGSAHDTGASIAETCTPLGFLRGEAASCALRARGPHRRRSDPARGEYPAVLGWPAPAHRDCPRARPRPVRVLIADEPGLRASTCPRARLLAMDLLGSITRERAWPRARVHDLATVASTCDWMRHAAGLYRRGRGHPADHVRPARAVHARTD